MKETMYCPMCESEQMFHRETVREEYEVRGEKIVLDVPRLICATCSEPVIDESFGDPMLHLYAEYRRRHGLLTPGQIRAIREKYSLSQDAFAALLGTSPATLARYEGGSIQDKAYDQLLRACDSPTFMRDLISREAESLSARQRRAVESALQKLEVDEILTTLPDCSSLDYRRYAAVVVWFCKQLQSIPQTKLCKLLFYTDFLFYQRFGRSLTGSNYRRYAYGPVPCNYETLRGIMEMQGVIQVEEISYSETISGLEFRAGPASDPVADALGPDALPILQIVADAFGEMTAKKISRRSHEESAWRETAEKAIISFSHAHRLSVKLPELSR